jgi:glycine C-acetyltransferase
VVELLRQRSRPYLFSNSLAPAVVGGSLAAIEAIERGDDLRQRLWENTEKWRGLLEAGGFELIPGSHPIVPVMFGDERRAKAFSEALWEEGVLAVAFAFPVVPKGRARIRTQMSAGLTGEDLERAAEAFVRAKRAIA